MSEPVAFEVIERLTDAPYHDRIWTNLACALHDHGTSEQFHSELKSDLDIEQLPSGKLCVNRIVLLCGMLAFNLLRTLGQEVIVRADLAPVKIKVPEHRDVIRHSRFSARPVRQDLLSY